MVSAKFSGNDQRKRRHSCSWIAVSHDTRSVLTAHLPEGHQTHHRKEPAITFQRSAACIMAGAQSVRTAILPQPVIR